MHEKGIWRANSRIRESMGGEDMSNSWMMIVDTLLSIHTSCDVPAGALFGPCDPQHISLGDSIAFIALRCSDRHTTAYTHQVETSMPSVFGEGPVWLRLVRSARNAEEQNLEACVKDGRMFYRAMKNISKNSELLVWYGKDLTELLGLTHAQKTNKGYKCSYCRQSFLFEFPLLAHQRFLCTETSERFRKSSSSTAQNKPSMDFHNLAKNLEKSSLRDMRRHSVDSESEESDEEDLFSRPCKRVRAAFMKSRLLSSSSLESSSSEISMNNEGRHSLPWTTNCHGNIKGTGPQKVPSAVSDQEKSAFIQPPRSMSRITNLAMTLRLSQGVSPVVNSMAAALVTKPQASAVSSSLLKQQALVYESGLWSKTLQAECSLLPAVLSPLSLPAQNWCAKCSLSFHMTSDLVQHMRSHHKRSAEQMKQHSEMKLRCPVCDEGFRERHHLSRHMSSHV